MGYRNYFAIAEKEKVDEFLKLSEEDRVRLSWKKDAEYFEDDELDRYIEMNYINWFGLREAWNAEEVIECGKYFDSPTAEKIKEDSINLSNEDGEFNIVKPEGLLIAAKYYRDKTVDYYKKVIRSTYMTDEEIKASEDFYGERPNIESIFRTKINDLINGGLFPDERKNQIKGERALLYTWDYEFDLFNLIHLYKTIDWDKYYLIWQGY